MTSVIVFSKDRPMQLHAYLESLLMFSDLTESTVSVLYKKNERISYDRVISSYPQVKWIEEIEFITQLDEILKSANEYVLFGCDDVVFNGSFSVYEMEKFLHTHESVFGYSIRLGLNFAPVPKDIQNVDGHMVWNWKNNTDPYYDYPWELDCTLYRTSDAKELFNKYKERMFNPNYLESIVDINKRNCITRDYLACANGRGRAICITVNRVQDTHMNDFDKSTATDIYTLSKLYNDENNKLDIKKIAKKRTNRIHVDATFFLLEQKTKKINVNSKYNIFRYIYNLLRNLKYLSTVNLREENWYMARDIASKVKTEILQDLKKNDKYLKDIHNQGRNEL